MPTEAAAQPQDTRVGQGQDRNKDRGQRLILRHIPKNRAESGVTPTNFRVCVSARYNHQKEVLFQGLCSLSLGHQAGSSVKSPLEV